MARSGSGGRFVHDFVGPERTIRDEADALRDAVAVLDIVCERDDFVQRAPGVAELGEQPAHVHGGLVVALGVRAFDVASAPLDEHAARRKDSRAAAVRAIGGTGSAPASPVP